MCRLHFDEESIYEISKLYLNKFCNGPRDRWTDKPKAIYPLNFYKVEGIKIVPISPEGPKFVAQTDFVYIDKDLAIN